MNPDAIEAALLSGKPLQPPSSASDRQYTEHDDAEDDAQEDEDHNEDDDLFTDSRPRRSTAPTPGPDPTAAPYANAQGRQTGVKGVLDDRRASALASQRAQNDARASKGAEQAARAMVGMTIHEEDAHRRGEESKEDGEARERWRRARRHELEREKERERAQEGMQRGGLREVGREGFLGAVERRGWVVVLIYEPVSLYCRRSSRVQNVRADNIVYTPMSNPLILPSSFISHPPRISCNPRWAPDPTYPLPR